MELKMKKVEKKKRNNKNNLNKKRETEEEGKKYAYHRTKIMHVIFSKFVMY